MGMFGSAVCCFRSSHEVGTRTTTGTDQPETHVPRGPSPRRAKRSIGKTYRRGHPSDHYDVEGTILDPGNRTKRRGK